MTNYSRLCQWYNLPEKSIKDSKTGVFVLTPFFVLTKKIRLLTAFGKGKQMCKIDHTLRISYDLPDTITIRILDYNDSI
jgi:hypothetical protein